MKVIDASDTSTIIRLIKKGVVVIIPTETVYGLVGIPSIKNRNHILQLKQRSTGRPLGLIVDSMATFRKIIYYNDQIGQALQSRRPRSVTVVGYGRCDWPFFNVVQHNGLVGVRVTNSKWLQNIIRHTGPILATSVNISGQPPLKELHHLLKFGAQYVVTGHQQVMTQHPSAVYHAIKDAWMRI